MFQKINKKEVEPRIYAIAVESESGEGITQVLDYCLEDAILKAREEAAKNLHCDIKNCRVKYWNILTLEELRDKIFSMEIIGMPSKSKDSKHVVEINGVMKKIIENNDVKLFKKVKGRLSKNEIDYIKEKLSIYDDNQSS